jgi:hypothetical protein
MKKFVKDWFTINEEYELNDLLRITFTFGFIFLIITRFI